MKALVCEMWSSPQLILILLILKFLEPGADLYMVQLMPLPLTVSCFSTIQIGFTFLVPAHLGSPGQRAVKRVCVCVCMRMYQACVSLYFSKVTDLK